MLAEGIAVLLLLAFDQAAKYAARAYLRPIRSRTLIPGVLGLRYSENTGAAFSSFSGSTGLLTGLTALLVAGILIWLLTHRQEPRRIRVPLLMIFAGGAGNLIDRLCFSYVTDFIELLFVRFAIFNLADILITVGAVLLAIAVLFYGGTRDGAK